MTRFNPVWGSRTYIMGIVNVTPDSFSGDGSVDPDEAVAHGVHLAQQGADILDVGGESSRPGAEPVDPEEEAHRTVERGEYYVIQPMLPELAGPQQREKPIGREYSSADRIMSHDQVRLLLETHKLMVDDRFVYEEDMLA